MLLAFLSCVFSRTKGLRAWYLATESRGQSPMPLKAIFGWCNSSLQVFFSHFRPGKLTHSDFIESFSSLFVIRYLTTSSLITGPYCDFQAVGLIWGVMASAIWTFVITINTFLLLAGGRKTRAWLIDYGNSGWGRWVVCAVIWIFILVSGLFGFMEPFDVARGPYCPHHLHT